MLLTHMYGVTYAHLVLSRNIFSAGTSRCLAWVCLVAFVKHVYAYTHIFFGSVSFDSFAGILVFTKLNEVPVTFLCVSNASEKS